MKATYDACINEDSIKKLGVAPLLNVVNDIKKLFPATTSQSEEPAIQETILFLAKIGVSALVSSGTGADDKDPDTVVVSVAPPYRIGLPAKERYEDAEILKKYKGVLAEVLSALLPDEKFPEALFDAVVEFEKKLAAASPNAEDRQDVTVSSQPSLLMNDADYYSRNTTTQCHSIKQTDLHLKLVLQN